MIGSAVIFLLIGCAVAYMFLFQNQGGSPKKPRTVASTTTAKPEPKTDASPDATADPSNANAQPETAKSEGAMTKDEPKTSATEPAATVKADAVPPPEVKPAPTGPKLIMTRAARRFNPVDFKDAMERIANNRSEILMPPVYEFEVASPIEGIVNDARVTIRPAKRGQRAVFKLKLREKTLLQFGSGCEVSFQDIDFQIEPADSSAALFDYLDNKPVEFSNCTFAGRAQESLLQKK